MKRVASITLVLVGTTLLAGSFGAVERIPASSILILGGFGYFLCWAGIKIARMR
jgi:hypothetical protein